MEGSLFYIKKRANREVKDIKERKTVHYDDTK